jgi:hypothetical protein
MYLLFIFFAVLFLALLAIRKEKKKIDFEKTHREREKANAPKFLYLRGFIVDGDDSGNGNMSIMKLLPKELDLANKLINLGHHLVAVGKPDEEIPYIGFDRKKFSQETWQQEVLNLIEESSLIIYRPDTSPGVLWEMGKILELNYREKLILWADMGFGDNVEIQKARYNIFRRKILEQFSEKVPEYERNKSFMVSNKKNNWNKFLSISQTPIYKKLAEKI